MINPEILSAYIQQLIVIPLNRALDGKDPGRQLESYCRTMEDITAYVSKMQYKRISDIPVDMLILILRNRDQGRQLAEALMPLYKELLFHPEKRMLDDFDVCDMDRTTYQIIERKRTGDELIIYERKVQAKDVIQHALDTEKYLSPLFGDNPILDCTKLCIKAKDNGYDQIEPFVNFLRSAINDGYVTDWDDVCAKVKEELKDNQNDPHDVKAAYFYRLLAVAMVMRNESITQETKTRLLDVLCKSITWLILEELYDFLYKPEILTDKESIKRLFDLFFVPFVRYTHLLYILIRLRPSVMNGYLNDRQLINETFGELCNVLNKKEQNDDLDEIFWVLFPFTSVVEYTNDALNPFLTEALSKLEGQKKVNQEQTATINEQKVKIDKLSAYQKDAEKQISSYKENAIFIEEFKQAIESTDDLAEAKQNYSHMDFMLLDNPVWQKHRYEVAALIVAKSKEMDQKRAQALAAIADKKTIGTLIMDQHNYGFDALQIDKENNQTLLN